MKTFKISAGDKLILYGAGIIGKKYYSELRNEYKIVAFLDQKANSVIDIDNINVYEPGQYRNEKYRRAIPVVLCIHNGQVHSEIAHWLYELGYRKIIFLPLENYQNSKASEQMKVVYESFIEGNKQSLHRIPYYEEFLPNLKIENTLRETEKYVILRVSYELLYTAREPLEHEKSFSSKDVTNKVCDKPISTMQSHIELYNFFMNGCGDYNLFLDAYYSKMQHAGGDTRKQLLQERYKVYEMLNTELQEGKDAYEYSPLEAIWNEKGYFNVTDGHNRAAFLLLHNFNRVPIRISKEDYEKYKNSSKAREIYNYIINNNLELYTPIPYFDLFSLPAVREKSGRTVLACIQYFLKNYSVDSIIDLSVYNSYFARNSYRMKICKVTSVEIDNTKYQMARMLNELFYIDNMDLLLRQDRFSVEGQYDVAFILGSFDLAVNDTIVQYLNGNISRMLIWESKSDSVTEKKLLMENSKFKKYTFLGNFYVDGYCSEIGAFEVLN